MRQEARHTEQATRTLLNHNAPISPPTRGCRGEDIAREDMAGSQFELLGLLTLTGFAFVCGSWLFVAACEAFSHSVAVGLLLLAFAAVLFATAASVALGGVTEWLQAQRADVRSADAAPLPDRVDGKIRTLRAALRQPVYISILLKVLIFGGSLNVIDECLRTKNCERIFLVDVSNNGGHNYCEDPTNFWASRTIVTEMVPTVRSLLLAIAQRT